MELPNTSVVAIAIIQCNSETECVFGYIDNEGKSFPLTTSTYSAFGDTAGKMCLYRPVPNQNLFVKNGLGYANQLKGILITF